MPVIDGVIEIMQQYLSEEKMKKIANDYFAAWNKHDLHSLKVLFDEKIVLKDWEIHEVGIENVLNANSNIFQNVPNIKVVVLGMAISKKKVMAEIKVLINEEESIDVVDILEFENDLIKQIKAFKC
tara:strand:- start:268 stop:645 length:378 start_codon:yes stop_codon:yes gene_type:complete